MVRPAGRSGRRSSAPWPGGRRTPRELVLERLTRRYGECFETAERMLADLPPDDPARPWFESWRCALTIAVAPEVGLAHVDDVIARAVHHARAGND